MIGVWSTTDERKTGAAGDLDPANFAQVSRLGNPLVNEVVIPLALKDAFNTIRPDQDATIPAAVDAVQNPRLPELINAIYGVPCRPTPRNDLTEIFLQGISKANAGLSGDPADGAAGRSQLARPQHATSTAPIVPVGDAAAEHVRAGQPPTRTGSACSPATSRASRTVAGSPTTSSTSPCRRSRARRRPASSCRAAHHRLGRPQRPRRSRRRSRTSRCPTSRA